MDTFNYIDSSFPIRQDLADAYSQYWQELAAPGNWFTGAQRVAIAAEARNAVNCPFCAQRKQSLSPYTQGGEHLCGNVLEAGAVDMVHRVITDQSRITNAFIHDQDAHGLSEEQYVELVGIAVNVFSIDEFNRALGIALDPLPEPLAGEPDHYRPAQAERGTGYVAMLGTGGATGKEADLWFVGRSVNVLRALSLVPDAVRSWRAVSEAQYLTLQKMMDFGGETGRTINRMQIELVAGRVSSINECFY